VSVIAQTHPRAPGAPHRHVDVHQHLWPEPLLAALARRTRPPLIRRSRDGWVLRIAGEPEWPVDPADHDPVRRALLVERDGLDRAIVALSSPLGIEALPAGEAEVLLAASHAGVVALGDRLPAWASAGLDRPDPRRWCGWASTASPTTGPSAARPSGDTS
jgi:6-methylsalicylate decarboxylase